MATLTEATYYTRRAITIGGIFLVGFIVIKVSSRLARDIWSKFKPTPPPPPTVAFGKLPQIEFPEKPAGEKPTSKLSFKLETIEGTLPSLPGVGRVYFMPIGKPDLLASERASQKVRKMGFTTQPQKLNESTYRWLSKDSPPVTLEMNIYTGKFHLRYPYETDQELLVSKNLPSDEQAKTESQNFLKSNQLLTGELEKGEAQISYWGLNPSGLVPAISLSEAEFVRVNLFRADLDELKILPADPKESLVNFLFSGSKNLNKKIVEIKYTHFPVEKESFATYPLKPIAAAWQEMQEEKGYVAHLGQNNDGQIIIRRISLAYYDPAELQTYLQPIYVFEGDKNFFGYVPAITPEWTE